MFVTCTNDQQTYKIQTFSWCMNLIVKVLAQLSVRTRTAATALHQDQEQDGRSYDRGHDDFPPLTLDLTVLHWAAQTLLYLQDVATVVNHPDRPRHVSFFKIPQLCMDSHVEFDLQGDYVCSHTNTNARHDGNTEHL